MEKICKALISYKKGHNLAVQRGQMGASVSLQPHLPLTFALSKPKTLRGRLAKGKSKRKILKKRRKR